MATSGEMDDVVTSKVYSNYREVLSSYKNQANVIDMNNTNGSDM